MQRFRHDRSATNPSRRGAIFVIASVVLVVAFAFAAFAVDLGYVTLSRSELQKTADAATLAAVIELGDAFGPGALLTQAQADAAARAAAVAVAAANSGGGRTSVYADGVRDVKLGRYDWDTDSQTWIKNWGAQPYTLAQIRLHRDQAGSSLGDQPLDLFFAPVIGHKHASLAIQATAALKPGTGIRIRSGSGRKADVLPFALDIDTWTALMNGVGADEYKYNSSTGAVTTGGDGVKEVNLYPYGNQTLPPGNRGTVDFGHSGNSTADIARQIVHGLNENDLSYFGGQLSTEDGPLTINGDTGISAGVKDELELIKGKPRLIPIFTAVSGNGNNANYTIVKFVGVRIMNVQLTGKPTSKRVIIQPAPFVSDLVITGETTVVQDSYFAPGGLVP